jgi:hypothetical protein
MLLFWASLQGTVWASSKQNIPEAPPPETGANWVPGYAIVLLGIVLGLLVSLRSSNRQDPSRAGGAVGMTPEELQAAAAAAAKAGQKPRPRTRIAGVKSGRREDVRAVAVYQKGILVCILTYLLAIVAMFLVPLAVRPVIGFLVMGVIITAVVFVSLLCAKIYSTAVAIIFAVLTLVPCLNLIMLLVLNAKATSILRENGHTVGLMGADLSEF